VSAAQEPPALQTQALAKRFGGLTATDNVTLQLARGERRALIGPNGAGKTTLINLLTGVLAPSSGSITLYGEDITRLAPHRRVARGLVRTFQINQLYAELTPLQTVALAVAHRSGHSRRWWRGLGGVGDVRDQSMALLERFGLDDVANDRTAFIAYGKRRLLEIAAALACGPRVLLLDEPGAGVPAAERREILHHIDALPADVTVLLIEHDMDLVFSFAQRVSVLVSGALLAEGTPKEIRNDPRVKAVYLGERAHG
jgi:branched-chain amino acid transport system ATP-binding protein